MSEPGEWIRRGVIGSGGYATVYLVEDPETSQQYAVKVLAENWSHNADAVARFLAEGQTLQRLAGPGFLPVHGVGRTDSGQPFIIMDYADQGSLQDWLDRPFITSAWPSSLILIGDVALAVGRAHEQKIAHRDLKPQNILLKATASSSPNPATMQVFVADFGLARALEEASRLTTVVAGTWPYMAPEQFEGRADLRCDVYALGVIAYRLLAGRLPFEHVGYESIYRAKLTESFEPLSRAANGVPVVLATAVDRALSADPGQRPSTATEWWQGIPGNVEAVSSGPTIRRTTPPPPVPEAAHDPPALQTSPIARTLAMDHLRMLADMLATGRLSVDEFQAMKASKLAEVGLVGRAHRGSAIQTSPIGQSMALSQADEFKSLVTDGVLTPGEYAEVRRILFATAGLL